MTINLKERIEAANKEVIDKMLDSQPVLIDVMKLKEFNPTINGMTLTHSGPPVKFEDMSGAQVGAVIAACIYEKWAKNETEAISLAKSDQIHFSPNHEFDGVGPMAGVLSPNMNVFVVEDRKTKLRSYSSIEYDVLFGAYDDDAIDEVRRWNDIYYPAIKNALAEMKGIELKPLMTQALSMGDELHSRQVASSSLFAKILAGSITSTNDKEVAVKTLKELSSNELTFLPIVMAACKVTSMNVGLVPYSTIVTVMARNGTEFGIKVSGLGNKWFTAPAQPIETMFFPGFSEADAGRDIGDSVIAETNGLGGFAFAAAPAIAGLVNARFNELVDYSLEMRKICFGRNQSYGIPYLDYDGTAVGIDIRKVLQTNIVPILDTATAHKEPGHRIIGAGIVKPPLACFEKALEAWFNEYNE